jgi:hypothetical protein
MKKRKRTTIKFDKSGRVDLSIYKETNRNNESQIEELNSFDFEPIIQTVQYEDRYILRNYKDYLKASGLDNETVSNRLKEISEKLALQVN